MGLILTLVVGAVVGWLASLVMKTNAQMGALMNILVGIVGAWLGSVLAGAMGFAATSQLASLVVSHHRRVPADRAAEGRRRSEVAAPLAPQGRGTRGFRSGQRASGARQTKLAGLVDAAACRV